MTWFVLFVFVVVYAGMIFGGFRGLALDRTGIVVLGAIAIVAAEILSPGEAWSSVDVPTIALLFGLMIVSAQFRLGGFYTFLSEKLERATDSPRRFLAKVVVLAAVLSALLANDIVCLAVAPVLADICSRRRLNPVPFLLALACASNVGSAATLIGNPQNMLIGQVLELSFAGYLAQAIVPSALGLVATWFVIARRYAGRWEMETPRPDFEHVAFSPWHTAKGTVVIVALVAVFLWGGFPREVAALAAAGVLMLSRRLASPRYLALVDWNLLVLFIGLFVVNHALAQSGLLETGVAAIRSAGIDPDNGGWLFALTVALSNLVSNVPATMLLLPSTNHPQAGLILALASTLAGNLIVVGSIANIIVVEQAAKLGIRIDALEHAKTGVPVTLATLAIAAAWLALM